MRTESKSDPGRRTYDVRMTSDHQRTTRRSCHMRDYASSDMSFCYELKRAATCTELLLWLANLVAAPDVTVMSTRYPLLWLKQSHTSFLSHFHATFITHINRNKPNLDESIFHFISIPLVNN